MFNSLIISIVQCFLTRRDQHKYLLPKKLGRGTIRLFASPPKFPGCRKLEAVSPSARSNFCVAARESGGAPTQGFQCTLPSSASSMMSSDDRLRHGRSSLPVSLLLAATATSATTTASRTPWKLPHRPTTSEPSNIAPRSLPEDRGLVADYWLRTFPLYDLPVHPRARNSMQDVTAGQ